MRAVGSRATWAPGVAGAALAALAATLGALPDTVVAAAEPPASQSQSAASVTPIDASGAAAWHGRIELKRQNTARGTDDESTKTTLRFETFLAGPVRLVRLDLPFPDETPDREGDPFAPRLGDIKLRLGFQPLQHGDVRFPSFIEVALPTADPAALGTGKVQVSLGLRMVKPLAGGDARRESRFEAEIEQVTSVAGDEARNDINHTKLELTWFTEWQRRWSVKLKLKPSVDWQKDGDTGAVGECEGGLNFAQHWRTTLMLGRRLWGPAGIAGTYDDRIEATLSRRF